ncbi:MAG: HAD-IC family P-type ATPase, partial [Nanoarchaeota archaeon]|nr:HAD-IC family P-type ATPase [Nanoarchaeota archaeon]
MLNPELIEKTRFWALTPEKTLELLEGGEEGLSGAEARERQKTFDKNTIRDGASVTKTKILWNQFKSPLILILLIAGGVTVVLESFTDGIFIFAAVFINTALGFYQEYKAETTLESLRSYIKERARLIRENIEEEKDAEEIVPGDIVRLRTGARVPADIRLLGATDLEIDESILTGESLPVVKKIQKTGEGAPVAERHCMVFGGTLVTNGMAVGVVTATGNRTELGRIAAMVRKEERGTPLQRAIARFSVRVTVALLIFIGILFFIGTWKGYGYFEMFLISVAVAVSVVPEGLPIALTVILAVGVKKLAKRKGVIRQLLAAETLGRTTVIMTDKTGTLTEGKMELSAITGEGPKEEVLALAMMALGMRGEETLAEGPIERACAKAAKEYKILLPDARQKIEFLEYKPFNSRDKWSGACTNDGKTKTWAIIGAPEVITERIGAHASQKETIHKETDRFAREGGRVLAVAKGKSFLG